MLCVHDFFVAQLCLTLCNSMDYSPPSSSIHGILQARILEWVAMPSSRESSWPRNWTQVPPSAGRFFTAGPSGKPKIVLKKCSNYYAMRSEIDPQNSWVHVEMGYIWNSAVCAKSYAFDFKFPYFSPLVLQENHETKGILYFKMQSLACETSSLRVFLYSLSF